MTIHTQPEPDHVARAGDHLEAILLADPEPSARIAVAAALATLYDVHPPYPPRPDVTEAIDLHTGLDLALTELGLALRASTTPDEAVRLGLAGRALQPLRRRP